MLRASSAFGSFKDSRNRAACRLDNSGGRAIAKAWSVAYHGVRHGVRGLASESRAARQTGHRAEDRGQGRGPSLRVAVCERSHRAARLGGALGLSVLADRPTPRRRPPGLPRAAVPAGLPRPCVEEGATPPPLASPDTSGPT